jgi:hypothetical protein
MMGIREGLFLYELAACIVLSLAVYWAMTRDE